MSGLSNNSDTCCTNPKQESKTDVTNLTNITNLTNTTDTTFVNMSMTKANKILNKLREKGTKSKPSRYTTFTEKKYSFQVNLLNYDKGVCATRTNDIEVKFNDDLRKKILIEKWKNRLFELNIKYKIHEILSEIEICKIERNMCDEILAECKSTMLHTMKTLPVSMDAVKSSEKKYDFNWDVTPFDVSAIKLRMSELDRKISKLESKRDDLNIQNTFSLELTQKEKEYANLDY